MQVDIINNQKDLKIPIRKVKRLVKGVIELEGFDIEEVAIHFLDLKTMCEMHQQFFNDSSPTDCMSFPLLLDGAENGYRHLGDVCVCPAVAIDYAKKHQIDCYQELSLYIIHGLLHLMGYDDMTRRDKQKMRRAEKKHMERLKGYLLNE